MPRQPSARARTRMLDAASEILLAEGVHGFTVDAVAERSGVAKTTIYRHFPTKNDLVIAAIDGAMAVPPTPDNGNLRDDLIEFLDAVRPIFADARIRALFYDLWSIGARDPELDRMEKEMMANRAGPTLTIYRRGRERGEIDPSIDYPTALEIIEGPFIVRSLVRPETLCDMDLEALVDQMLVQLRG